MGRLIYAAIASLDGYVADEAGGFGWAQPDPEVHTFINAMERPVGTQLLGRRMYEVLRFWETGPDEPPHMREFTEIWRSTDKIVFSRSLAAPDTARTRIERDFSPDAVRQLKESAQRDISIGGAELAGQALRAGLVDELHLYLTPAVVGGGTKALPDALRLDLELLDERRFGSGFVHLRYRLGPRVYSDPLITRSHTAA